MTLITITMIITLTMVIKVTIVITVITFGYHCWFMKENSASWQVGRGYKIATCVLGVYLYTHTYIHTHNYNNSNSSSNPNNPSIPKDLVPAYFQS